MSTKLPPLTQAASDKGQACGINSEDMAALECELIEIKEALWPNQTGLPNEHRNAAIAVKAIKGLSAKRIEELERELDDAKAYKQAIDQSLVCAHIGIANGKPKEELHSLIQWEIGVHEYFEIDRLKKELAEAKQLPHALELQSLDRKITELDLELTIANEKLACYAQLERQHAADIAELNERLIDFGKSQLAAATRDLDERRELEKLLLEQQKHNGDLIAALERIHDEADAHADGAPDASSHDKLCNHLAHQTAVALAVIKSKHPEL